MHKLDKQKWTVVTVILSVFVTVLGAQNFEAYDLHGQINYVFQSDEQFRLIRNLDYSEKKQAIQAVSMLHSPTHSLLEAFNSLDLDGLTSKSGGYNLTESCRYETEYLLTKLNAESKLKVFDAWGKLQAGLLEGNSKWLGGFDECLSITSNTNGSLSHNFTTRYCVASLTVPKLGSISLGTCVPKGCTSLDVMILMNSIYSHVSNQTITAVCKPMYSERTMSGGRQFALVFVSIIAGFCVLATLYELALQLIERFGQTKEPINSSLEEETPLIGQSNSRNKGRSNQKLGKVSQTILCFSLYSNSKKILDTTQPPGAINCINGIRFFSMSWVILGHFMIFFTVSLISNKLWIMDLLERTSMQPILNATVSVDSFFVMSGLLVAYLFLKDFTRRRMDIVGFFKALPMIYLQRYLRLTPAYGIMMLYVACIIWYTWDGPDWPYDPLYPTSGAFDANCRKNWWMSLLYVNNLFKVNDECVGWGWYLANDFQFFLVAPFVVFLFYKHNMAGLLVAFCMTLGSTVAAVVVSYDQKSGLTLLPGISKSSYTPSTEKFPLPEYFVPWTRFQTYGIGLIAGLILFKLKQIKYRIPTLLNMLMWGVSAGLLLSVLYGPYGASTGGHIVGLAESVAYSGLSRAAWGIGLSYVLIACALGQGGWIDEFLSWKAFIPLSRLTYCAYLIHIPVLSLIAAGSRELVYYNEVIIARDFLFLLVSVMFLAFVFSALYEVPFVNLDKLFLSPLSIKRDRNSVENSTQQDEHPKEPPPAYGASNHSRA